MRGEEAHELLHGLFRAPGDEEARGGRERDEGEEVRAVDGVGGDAELAQIGERDPLEGRRECARGVLIYMGDCFIELQGLEAAHVAQRLEELAEVAQSRGAVKPRENGEAGEGRTKQGIIPSNGDMTDVQMA